MWEFAGELEDQRAELVIAEEFEIAWDSLQARHLSLTNVGQNGYRTGASSFNAEQKGLVFAAGMVRHLEQYLRLRPVFKIFAGAWL